MIPFYAISVATLALLGLAFMVSWNAARLNRTALLWGIAHLSLAGATLLGFQYQLHALAWAGGLSTLLTGVFLVLLYAGAEGLRGRWLPWRTLAMGVAAMVVLVGLVGFAGSSLVGRIMVLTLMLCTYTLCAALFWGMRQRVVAAAFALKVLSYSVYLLDPSTAGTPFQSLQIMMVGWLSSLVLGLVLVYVTIGSSQKRLSKVLQYLSDPLVVRRMDGRVVFCNQRFAQLAGVSSPAALVGQPTPLMANAQYLEEAQAVVRKVNAMASAGPMRQPLRLERTVTPEQGEPFPAEVFFSSYMDLGYPVVLAQIRDLTERKKAEAERLRHASTDPLTGLANRSFLQQQLDAMLWLAQREETHCAVLLIDLDHFKRINDTLGHAAGDDILCEAARQLQAQLAPGELLARLSGDEFALVLTGLSGLGILQVETRAQATLQMLRRNFKRGGIDYQVDASMGVALSDAKTTQSAVLLQHAEIAMYQAKEQGRGKWCFFSSGMDERLTESLRIEAALRQAIAREELSLHYQPIYSAESAHLVKAEALLRWHNPQLGAVSPGRFIPIAEETALILEIGRWVLERAIRQVAQWHAQGWSTPIVSINVSARQFAEPDFAAELFATLERHGVPPGCIELELTETLLASDQAGMTALLQRLHEAGVGLSLDDFGTGYSSLSYLAHFHLHTVKIDRSFVMHLQHGNRNHSLVRAIIAMAHSLNLAVVAEGVETEEQRAILLAEDCDYLQGYLLGRPMPADALPAQASQLTASANR